MTSFSVRHRTEKLVMWRNEPDSLLDVRSYTLKRKWQTSPSCIT